MANTHLLSVLDICKFQLGIRNLNQQPKHKPHPRLHHKGCSTKLRSYLQAEQCQVCLDLKKQVAVEGVGGRWTMKVNDSSNPEDLLFFEVARMKKAAKSGCPICTIVSNGMKQIRHEIPALKDRPSSGKFILNPGHPLEVEFGVGSGREFQPLPDSRLEFYTLTSLSFHNLSFSEELLILEIEIQDARFAAIGPAREVQSNISAEKCAPTILKWIEMCLNSHDICSQAGVELPNRLIDVHLRNESSVALIDSRENDVDRHSKYVTLSHCCKSYFLSIYLASGFTLFSFYCSELK